eukprot:TRINITY_DN19183_c0_g1_i1.p1 TRINITY_DN19183_c0_g1~~TRINITY_DN19183_c0_g1_i1.p1  ORF type:complete len:453 (-),score=91.41 TRINITY_DN19183_c0_g1_i1:48-1406(-)
MTVTNTATNDKPARTFTWNEIGKHKSANDCWVVVKGKVYDVTGFVSEHPGGRLILNGAGRDATPLVMSYHPLYVQNLIKKFEIGQVQGYKPYYQWDSEFYTTLKKRVEQVVRDENLTNHSYYMYFKSLALLTIWFCLYYYTIMKGNIWLAIPFGYFHSQFGITVAHDGLHGAYSKYSWINGLAAAAMDLMGASGIVWLHQHNVGHHPNSNRQGTSHKNDNDEIDEYDPDARSGAPYVRITPNQPWAWWHQWQHIYIWPMISLISAKWVVNDVRAIIRRKYITIEMFELRTRDLILTALAKSLFVFYMIALPLTYLTFSDWLTFFCFAMATSSYNFVLMFSVNHLTEDSMFPNDSVYNRDWARLQALTATNFAIGSKLWTLLSGGLNYQIEHHLFPGICHVHLPKISPVVQQTFKEYDVPYQNYSSYWDAFYAYYHHLVVLGQNPADEPKKVK